MTTYKAIHVKLLHVQGHVTLTYSKRSQCHQNVSIELFWYIDQKKVLKNYNDNKVSRWSHWYTDGFIIIKALYLNNVIFYDIFKVFDSYRKQYDFFWNEHVQDCPATWLDLTTSQPIGCNAYKFSTLAVVHGLPCNLHLFATLLFS